MVIPYLVFLALLGVQRLSELWLSSRHSRWAMAHGGVEMGQEHFPWMKALHGTFLFACAAEVVFLQRPFRPAVGISMGLLVAGAQGLRHWSMASLGADWNARVIVRPGSSVVVDGPYRFLRHPNYLAVVVEGFAIPLVHGAWVTALVFSGLNGVLLRARIRCEEAALAAHTDWATRMGRDAPLVRTTQRGS